MLASMRKIAEGCMFDRGFNDRTKQGWALLLISVGIYIVGGSKKLQTRSVVPSFHLQSEVLL